MPLLQGLDTVTNRSRDVKATPEGALLISGIPAKRLIATAISAATATLTVVEYPSGSVIPISAATCDVTLPALASGLEYTFAMKGATSFTLTAPSACLMIDGQTTAKTAAVWSTTPLYLCVTVVCDGTNWIVTSMTTLPDPPG